MKYLIVPRLSQRGAIIKRFINGDPSRRLVQLALEKVDCTGDVLVQENFTMLFPGINHLANSSHAKWVGLRTLEEPTIATYNMRHSILGSPVEFCSIG